MKIDQITDRAIWDAFLEGTQPHTFLHSWQWGKFNEQMGNKVYRIGIYQKAKLVCVALLVKVLARRGSFLLCPHGPICTGSITVSSILPTFTDYATRLAKDEQCHFVRICPLIIDTPVNRSLFKELGYKDAPIHMHPELAWMLDITPSEEDLLKNMRKTTRYSIRKAEKDGVAVKVSRDSSDLDTFWQVYQETVNRQHFTPFSKEYLSKEFELFNKENNATLSLAYYNNEVISAAMIIYTNTSAFYHHGASIQKYANIPASYLLQWSSILEAKKRGCKLYNFWGVVPEEQINHPWAGLSLFKRGFGGFSEAYVPAQDKVVSPKYWLNYAVETIRKKKRGY